MCRPTIHFISGTQGRDRMVISLKFLYFLVPYLWDKVADIIVISNVGSFIPGHNIDFMLWDKVADTIVISNVGNCIPGHNILKYRIN